MCGLAGIFDLKGRAPIAEAAIRAMTDAIVHRGPDGEGFHLDPGVALGHRRLAIIDPEGGKQPMYNEDGAIAVVLVGECYNFQVLVTERVSLGPVFSTRGDTEVIVHAWEQWGENAVVRFRGMFTFALWDRNRETLFIARDRLGKKPLYYSLLKDGRCFFASELKSILVHPEVPREIDPRAVEDYLAYGYVPDPRTIYRGIHKLPPAHTLTLRRGRIEAEPAAYWDVRFSAQAPLSEAAAADELIERLGQAVAMRLVSDVPLGAFLSGGVDSSAIVALMAAVSPEAVQTFSIAFKQKEYDESAYAERIARQYRTQHHVREVDADAFELIDRLALVYDEPFADSSAIPTFQVCAAAREGVTVALSGDGGDEVFAGYRRYAWHCATERVRRLVPPSMRQALFGLLGRHYPKLDWAPRALRAKHTFQELAVDGLAGYFISVATIQDDLRQRLISPDLRRQLADYHAIEVLARHGAMAEADDPLSWAQYVDLKTWLAGRMLVKVDRAAMANSLEVRVPLLDHCFVEWAATLPADLKIKGFERKYLFKQALNGRVPDDILYRTKQGFSVPLAKWFRGPLKDRVREALLGRAFAESGLIDGAEVTALLDQHQSGQRDHAAVLWSLLMLESFLRQVHQSVARPAVGGEALPLGMVAAS